MVNFTYIKCECDIMCHNMVAEPMIILPIYHHVQETKTRSFDRKYSKFIQNGGVIGLHLMYDASQLSKKEMQQRFPRDESYLEDPEDQIKYIQGRTKITLTPEQETLYYNLRWIPSRFHNVIIRQNSKQPGKVIEYRHPSQLDEIGLLSQVFIFTEDIDREYLLKKYCQVSRSVDTFEEIN